MTYDRTEWVCEGGHPYYLRDGEKYCPVCILIERDGLSHSTCWGKHTRPKGDKGCTVCNKYRKRQWWKTLDEKGVATCGAGHEVTHEDVSYSMHDEIWMSRYCTFCVREAGARANAAYVLKRETLAKAEGREVRRRANEVRRLPADYIDWVVALRLIEGKVDDVYTMSRGGYRGATPMEKWVAFHSTTKDYPYTRTLKAGPHHVRYQWEERGKQYGWKPKTLVQAMNEL